MARSERYQLPFLFPQRSAVQYEYGFISHDNPEDGSRFVRKLREAVEVRGPYDVAHHLMTNVFYPFEAFDQEELWVCAVKRRGSIGYAVPRRKESRYLRAHPLQRNGKPKRENSMVEKRLEAYLDCQEESARAD